jgi:WD40 repeat protein
MRLSRFALVLLAGFATATMAQTPQGGPDVIRLPAPLTSLALSATSNRAAVISRDKKLTLWDIADGRLLRTIALATADIDVTAISNDGRWIFTGDHSGNAFVWDANTGQAQLQLRLPRYPGAASFSHDGKFIAIAPMGDPVQVFDVAASRMLYQTNAVAGGTAALAFSRDGITIATADADTVVRIYDARTGKLVAENRDFLLEPLALDFNSDGRQVIAGSGDKILIFIDAASGKLIRRLQKLDEPVSISNLRVSPDGSLVAAILMKAENMTQPAPVVMWEVSSGQKKSHWMPTILALGIDWTRDGRLISAGADSDSLHIWRVP